MSGFVGILHRDGAPVERALLEQMTRFLAARGPDEQKVWIGESIGFAHALLRTTFEANTEHQPCTLEAQVWITADARIDGRSELCAALLAHGQGVTRATNDAELILHAYAVWGTQCVQHLIGDFAFAIWDARTCQLFCARDQFGAAPFFYAHLKNQFIFSNTLDCIRLHPDVSDKLNDQALGDMLLFGMNYDTTTTTFADIQRLPPAHTLTIRDDVVRCARYWSLPQSVDLQFRPAEETVAQFRTLFEQAIKDRLRTNRVAVPMSGGMDSSSIAVTARRLLQHEFPQGGGADFEMRAYTISLENVMQDEEPRYAGLVAEYADIPIRYIARNTPDSLEIDNPALVNPEPGLLPSNHASLEMMQDAATFSRVILSGLGGDPLLFPSSSFLLDALRRGQWRTLIHTVGTHVRMQHKLPPFYIRSTLKRRGRSAPTPPLPRWFNPKFAAHVGLEARGRAVHAMNQAQDHRGGMAVLPFWSNILANGDPGYTRFPIKYRFPFFDVRLLEFMLTVPPVPWFVGKTLLREALCGDLPEAILRRPKTPLGTNPLRAEAQKHPVAWMQKLAATPALEPYVNRDALRQMLETPQQTSVLDFTLLLHPLALAYWLRSRGGHGH